MVAAASEILALPSDKDWLEEEKKDPELVPIRRWIEHSELPATNELAKTIVRESQHYVINQESQLLERVSSRKNVAGEEIKISRRTVPQSLRKIVLALYHDSSWNGAHMGRDKTYERISRDFYFSDMYRYVAIYVKTCPLCQKVKDGKEISTSSLGSIPTTERWDILSIDLWGPLPFSRDGNKYVLTVVDSFTKWARAIPIPDKKMTTIAKHLWRHVFSIFGMPNRIHHDQGSEFVNGILKALTEMLLIDDSRTTAYHPQGNPFAERIHQFFGKAISAYVRDDQQNWDEYLDAIILAYNNAIHDTLGVSPAQLMFGRDLRAPGALRIPDGIKEIDHKEFAKRFYEIITKAQLLVMSRIDQARLKRSLLSNDKPLTSFEEGAEVLLYVPRVKPGKVHKLTPYWTGPFKVNKRGLNDKVYYLENMFGEKVNNPVSLSRLKPYHSRDQLNQLNEMGEKPSFAIRDDVSDTLIRDGAVIRTIPPSEYPKEFLSKNPNLIMDSETRSYDDAHLLIQPSNIFEGQKIVKETKRTPIVLNVSAEDSHIKKMIGHEV